MNWSTTSKKGKNTTGGKAVAKNVKTKKATSTAKATRESNRYERWRTVLGYSQEQVASLFGVSPYTVRAWERGVNAPVGSALKLFELAETKPGLKALRALTTKSAE
jgi:DNA-binding transcriptional regulator YiaG